MDTDDLMDTDRWTIVTVDHLNSRPSSMKRPTSVAGPGSSPPCTPCSLSCHCTCSCSDSSPRKGANCQTAIGIRLSSAIELIRASGAVMGRSAGRKSVSNGGPDGGGRDSNGFKLSSSVWRRWMAILAFARSSRRPSTVGRQEEQQSDIATSIETAQSSLLH